MAALGPGRGSRIPPHALRLTHRGWLVGPSLIAIVALSPYVGLKTTASLTMYSNLRTEGDRWNHLVLPEAMQVFGFQDDLVTIIRTDDPKLAELARNGDQMVWFSFAEHRRHHPDHDVELERDGRALRLERGQGLGDLDTPPHALAKVMSFRTVPVTGRCQH